MDHYIGMDAHSKTCTFVVQDKDGNIFREGKLSTNERNIKEFVRSIPGKKALVLEETNIAQWLYVLLKGEVDKLIVCHPAYLPKKSGPKNDYRDAVHLANQLRANNLTSVFHDETFLMSLRTLVHNYEAVNQEGINLKYKFKALLRSEGIPTQTPRRTFSNSKKWEEVKDPTKRFVAKTLYEQIVSNENLKSEYSKEFEKNYKKEPVIRNLVTIPGVGNTRAHLIAAYICSGHRFENKHKLWSYAKLIRHRDESDGHIFRNRTPHGRSELKAAFMSIAHGISITGKKTKTALHEYYRILIQEKGLSEQQARKALARKVAAICLVIMKKGCKYNDEHVKLSLESLILLGMKHFNWIESFA